MNPSCWTYSLGNPPRPVDGYGRDNQSLWTEIDFEQPGMRDGGDQRVSWCRCSLCRLYELFHPSAADSGSSGSVFWYVGQTDQRGQKSAHIQQYRSGMSSWVCGSTGAVPGAQHESRSLCSAQSRRQRLWRFGLWEEGWDRANYTLPRLKPSYMLTVGSRWRWQQAGQCRRQFLPGLMPVVTAQQG